MTATPPVQLTAAEAAAIMRVSKMTIYRLCKAEELPSFWVGRSLRIPEAALMRYMASGGSVRAH